MGRDLDLAGNSLLAAEGLDLSFGTTRVTTGLSRALLLLCATLKDLTLVIIILCTRCEILVLDFVTSSQPHFRSGFNCDILK